MAFATAALSDAELTARGERLGLSQDELGALRAARSGRGAPDRQRLDALVRMAEETFGSHEKAMIWLQRPTTALADLSPIDVVSVGANGVALVADLLKRIDHGLAV